MLTLPSFDTLWSHYPNGSAEDVKALIGGNINMTWVTNTCVIRICYALNRSGVPIHDGGGMHTAGGGDGYRDRPAPAPPPSTAPGGQRP